VKLGQISQISSNFLITCASVAAEVELARLIRPSRPQWRSPRAGDVSTSLNLIQVREPSGRAHYAPPEWFDAHQLQLYFAA